MIPICQESKIFIQNSGFIKKYEIDETVIVFFSETWYERHRERRYQICIAKCLYMADLSKNLGTTTAQELACSRLRDSVEKSFITAPFPSRARLIFALLVLIRPYYTI